MIEHKDIFENMPVPKALATLAIPTIISQVITIVYNMADTYFVGRTNDPNKVAAVSTVYLLFVITTALSNLFGIGGGSLISRLLGRGDTESAKKVCALSVYGTIFVALLYSLANIIFMEPLLRLVGISDNTLGYARAYSFIVIVIGGVPTTLSLTMSHLLRSEGYAAKASLGLGAGGILNIFLDYILMFHIMPPGQEVTGAAVATLISNLCMMAYFIITFIALRKRTVLSLSVKLLLPGFKYMREVFSVGLPSTISTFLSCSANITLNGLTAAYGDVAVAVMGVVRKIDMLPTKVGMGLCQGMMPLVAYNYSAKNYPRMRSLMRCARMCGMGFAVMCILLFETMPATLVGFFIGDAQVIGIGTKLLRICCLATPLMIFNFQMIYTFQTMGLGKQALLLSSCRQGLVHIPCIFLLNFLFKLYGLAWAQFLADGITLMLSVSLYSRVMKRIRLEEQAAL